MGGTFSLGEENKGFSSCRLLLLSKGGEDACDRLPHWRLTGPDSDCFWGKVKLRLDQVLNLGLVIWAFSRRDAVWGLGFLLVFVFRERGREKERERNINVWLPLTLPLLGTWPATQACVLTATLWFTDWRSIQQASPARACC